jgi:hypothetical protein
MVLTRRLWGGALGAMLSFWAASRVSVSASIGRGLDAISAMNRDASRRWRLLTLAGAFGGCCDARVEVAEDALRTCLTLALFGADFDGCTVVGVDDDLLLEACGFVKVTPFEARFWRMCNIIGARAMIDR